MQSALVVGIGSIGRRHARLFKEAGIAVSAADLRQDRLDQAQREIGLVAMGTDYREMLAKQRYDAALITVPGAFHTEVAQFAAEAGCHLFIEKPLSDRRDGLDRLEQTVKGNGLTAYTAYCYRFAPASERMKEIVDSGKLGRVLSARIQISSYMPDWHPWEDYRSYYVSKLALGGGARLDASHGVDLLRWICGEVKSVYALVDKISDLDMDADDFNAMVMRFANGIVGEAHIDLLGRSPRINAEIIGTDGTLLWDRISGKVEVYDAATRQWTVDDFGLESFVTCYERQAAHFIDCVRNKREPRTTLSDGRKTLEVLIAALKSSQQNRAIAV
jgi:predicted dehydrogenase